MNWFVCIALLLLAACTPSISEPLTPCDITEQYEVRGESMIPILHEGDTILVQTNRSCYNLSRDDIVLYDFAGNDAPVVKQIKAVPGDNWSLNGTDIVVNDQVLVNSEGIPYKTNAKARKMLSLYVEDYPIIEPKTYLILGNDPSGSLDATRFGLIDKSDLLGVVKEKKNENVFNVETTS